MPRTRYSLAISRARKLYQYLGNGRNRSTFDMGDGYVLKLPLHGEGELDNRLEARTYNDYPNDRFAQCILFDFHGVDALMMEKVEVDIFAARLPKRERPSWIGYIDCGQVGWTPDGRLVAFDFA